MFYSAFRRGFLSVLIHVFLFNFRWTGSSSKASTSISPTADASCKHCSLCSYNSSWPDGTSFRSPPSIPHSTLPTNAAAWIHALPVRELFTPGGCRWDSRRVPWVCSSFTPWLLLWRVWHASAPRIPPSGTTAPTSGTVPRALTLE